LTGGDVGGGLIGAARHLPSTDGDAGGGLIGVARHLLAIGGDPGDDLVDATHYQFVTRDHPVDALPHHLERCLELLLIERGGWSGQADRAGGVLRG
jgi:hypothetical protein